MFHEISMRGNFPNCATYLHLIVQLAPCQISSLFTKVLSRGFPLPRTSSPYPLSFRTSLTLSSVRPRVSPHYFLGFLSSPLPDCSLAYLFLLELFRASSFRRHGVCSEWGGCFPLPHQKPHFLVDLFSLELNPCLGSIPAASNLCALLLMKQRSW